MITDAVLAAAMAFCLGRVARAIAGPDALAVFALAVLSGTALIVGCGIGLLLLDAYSVARVLLASAVLAFGAWRAVERFIPQAPAGMPVSGAASVLALALVALPLASPAYQLIAMDSDAGVYFNHAMQLEADGRRFPAEGVDPAQLPPSLRARYLEDNRSVTELHPAVVPGLKVREDGALEFHALSGWPVLLSVSGRLLGMAHAQFIMAPVLMALGAFVILSLRAMAVGAAMSWLCGLTTMGLPIVVYFSRYPTVEGLLAMLFAGLLWSLVATPVRWRAGVAALAFAAFALVHVSSFLVLLLACVVAPFLLGALEQEARRQACRFLALAGAGQLLALEVAHALSRGYQRDLLAKSFGSFHAGLSLIGGLSLLAIVLAMVAHPRRRRLHGH